MIEERRFVKVQRWRYGAGSRKSGIRLVPTQPVNAMRTLRLTAEGRFVAFRLKYGVEP